MAAAPVAKMSRDEFRKQKELDEARKAGSAPAEVDESGKCVGNVATVVEREGEMAFENVGKEPVGPRRPRSTSLESALGTRPPLWRGREHVGERGHRCGEGGRDGF